jgi:hypothetical protein
LLLFATLGFGLCKQNAEGKEPYPGADKIAKEAERLFVVLAIDTNGRNAERLGILQDGWNMKRFFQDAFSNVKEEPGRSNRLRLTVLDGKNCNPDTVLGHIRSLNCKSTDSIFFYYSGHGAIPTGKFASSHFLAMKAGNLLRSQLATALEGTNCQLQIIMTDCCASFVDIPKHIVNNQIKGFGPTEGKVSVKEGRFVPNWRIVRALMLQHTGKLNINASLRGEPALGNPHGGPFTMALLASMASTWMGPYVPNSAATNV